MLLEVMLRTNAMMLMVCNTHGQIVGGGKGSGSRLDQLNNPTNVLIDKFTDSLIICDQCNQRVVRWSRRGDTAQEEIMIKKVKCYGLTMDDQRYLYISDIDNNEVRRYRPGEKNGTLVADGNCLGAGLNQLDKPKFLSVYRQQTESSSHRGLGKGATLEKLYYPYGLSVNALDTLYVVVAANNRVMRWLQGAKQGTVILGGNGRGIAANQFNEPMSFSFDKNGNLYVVDHINYRVQRFTRV
ncbi:unnamed protein product [Rotaria magnacalcarata]|uniref:Uncharacterized protein n=2 Tax=Rotaria magnacalcarata TaxID=392030 RepID=A0A820GAP2_9BILA|nr:unnamed protein product [Rotaria magnacalcarata]CAF4275286.1 unnamed protein product [Rotaria magnacalcarata]